MAFEQIVVDSKIMGGVPCIRGTRIPVSSILGYMAAGMTTDEILADFPQLSPKDLRGRSGSRATQLVLRADRVGRSALIAIDLGANRRATPCRRFRPEGGTCTGVWIRSLR